MKHKLGSTKYELTMEEIGRRLTESTGQDVKMLRDKELLVNGEPLAFHMTLDEINALDPVKQPQRPG